MCGAERRFLIAIPITLLLACGVAQGATAIDVTESDAPGKCAAIASAMAGKWPDPSTDIDSAALQEAGPLVAPPQAFGPPMQGPPIMLPAHCEIMAHMHARTGLDGQQYAIRFHVRLPVQWNGRLLFQGGGGLDGDLGDAVGGLPAGGAPALLRGFAVVSQNAGHDNAVNTNPARNGTAAFGFDPQARADFGYASLQPVAEAAKALTGQFYGQGPAFSYFAGCSGGGREGLEFAERYPEEFNGIIAADPGLSLPRAAVAEAWDVQSFAAAVPKDKSPALSRVAESFSDHDLQLVSDAVLSACDADDGLKDGMINAFMGCTTRKVRPALAARTCHAAKGPECLSAAQIRALLRSMAGPRDSAGKVLYSDWAWDAGIASMGWRIWKIGSADGHVPPLNLLIGGPALSGVFTTAPTPLAVDPQSMGEFILRFDFNHDAAKIYATDATFHESAWQQIAARSADLDGFRAHGGKLIIPQGVSDPVFSILDTLNWYTQVQQRNGGHAGDFARVFAVPGMNHCFGGPATDSFDALQSLMDWVEQQRPPDRILASSGPMSPWPHRTRPLCAYPAYARYKGSGDSESADSFECRVP
jgi:hypothetical protein